MPTILRKLGVHGRNAATKKAKTVQASPFNIAGINGIFERSYLKAFLVHNPVEEKEIFGDQISSASYAKDTTNLFWNNLNGQSAQLYIKSHVGYNGTAVDGVVASFSLYDQQGIDSAFSLALDLRTKLNAHAADATEHTTAADTVNFPITTPIAATLSELIALINSIITAYSAHETDAAKASLWAFHKGQEAGTHALASTTAVTTFAGCVTMLNDMRTKYNAHDADANAHANASGHQLTASVASSTPVVTLKIQAAYKGDLEYGTSGNRTGVCIVNGVRFATALSATVGSSATSATCDSVSGFVIGDMVVFKASGGTPGIVTQIITAIDENLKTISWSGVFSSASASGQIGDVVEIPGIQIHTYRKSITGIETEVNTDLGALWCSMEPTVTKYYVQNVHSENKWIKITDLSSLSTGQGSIPENQPTTTYMTAGVAGTSPTTSAHWSLDLQAFNGLPIRMICNPETTDITIQKSIETYCGARDDTPLLIANIAENQSKSQLETIGAKYQRSNDVFQVNVGLWVGVTDTFNTAPNAPDRNVPSVGASMAAWIQSIGQQGIHVIPATDSIILNGINSVEDTSLGLVSDDDRTELAEYGINIIQFVEGSGFRIRNFFTPSTATDLMFANGIIMRNFIKVSAQDSLQGSENTPNSFNRILSDRDAISTFCYRLWDRGSTGSVPAGESFGQQQNADGSLTKPTDHFQVTADVVNNPQDQINLGNRTIDMYFTYPTPAGSIQINVGILLR